MIRISLGRVGSGKTLMEVLEMLKPHNQRIPTYTNIRTDLPHVHLLTPNNLMKKTLIKEKRDGSKVYKFSVNVDFWKSVSKPINVVVDEAHTIIDARRSMSRVNKAMSDWLALIRRVIGGGDSRAGTLVYISQLPNRLDVHAREMANKVTYHICHWIAFCPSCGWSVWDSSEATDMVEVCLRCGEDMKKRGHFIDTYHFRNIDHFHTWDLLRERTYYKVERTQNVDKIFHHYDTFQWDNIIMDAEKDEPKEAKGA